MLKIVLSDHGKYVKYAQRVLDAMLAIFRIVENHMNIHHSILALLAVVKPEMETKDFAKYIDIVFDELDTEPEGEPKADDKEISDLFLFVST